MNTQEIASRLVELCRDDKGLQAIDELYASNIVSREPKGTPFELTEGFDAVKNKTIRFEESIAKVHSMEISDAIVAGNFFSLAMDFDATYHKNGRLRISEICVYEVKDGKIVWEEFFYHMG